MVTPNGRVTPASDTTTSPNNSDMPAQVPTTTPSQDDADAAGTATSTTNSCTVCGKAASSRCSRCSEGVDTHNSPLVTYYCGKTCQTSHWKIHKSECKSANNRCQLYRAVNLARDVFYQVQLACWHTKLERVEYRDDGKAHVTETKMRAPDHHLFKSPVGVLENEGDEEALMAHGAGKDCLSVMSGFVETLLEGSASTATFEEVVISPKLSTRVVVHHPEEDVSTGHKSHYLLRATLENHSVYAVDLTVAQYGAYKPMMPWSDYTDRFVQDVLEVKPFKTASSGGHACLSGPIERSHRLDFMLLGVRAAFEHANKHCDDAVGISAAKMLKLPRAEWESCSAKYFSAITILIVGLMQLPRTTIDEKINEIRSDMRYA